MKDFQLRNDTKLLFRENPVSDLTALAKGKKVLFIYGGGSVRKNGCYDDVKAAVDSGGGILFELSGASRELKDRIEKIDIKTMLSVDEITQLMKDCIR